MKDLPLDVLTSIFTCTNISKKALATYSLVCRSWRTPAQHQLFLHVHVKSKADAEAIIAAVTTNPYLQGVARKLTIEKRMCLPPNIICSLLAALPNLTSFTLIKTFLDACLELSFEEIGQLVPNVTSLDVVYFDSWASVLRLVGSMPSLTELDVRLCAGDEPGGSRIKAKIPDPRATGLRRLGLSMTSILARHGRFFSQLLKLFPGTENISVTGWLYTCQHYGNIPTFKFNDQIIPFVTSLYIRICGPGSVGNLDLTTFPNLTRVSLGAGPCVTADQIDIFLPLLPSGLRRLFIFAGSSNANRHFAPDARLNTDVVLSQLSRFKDLEYFSVTENMVGPLTQEEMAKTLKGSETILEILPEIDRDAKKFLNL